MNENGGDLSGGLLLFDDGARRIGLFLSRPVRIAAVEAVYPPLGGGDGADEPLQAAAAEGRIYAARSLAATLGRGFGAAESTALIFADYCLTAPPPVGIVRCARVTATPADGGMRRLWWRAPDGAIIPVFDAPVLGGPVFDAPVLGGPIDDASANDAFVRADAPPTALAALYDDGALIFPAAARRVISAAGAFPVAARRDAGPGARRIIDGGLFLAGRGKTPSSATPSDMSSWSGPPDPPFFLIDFNGGGAYLAAPRVRLIFDAAPVFTVLDSVHRRRLAAATIGWASARHSFANEGVS